MVSYYGSRGDISVSKYSKDVVGVIIYDSLGWDVDRVFNDGVFRSVYSELNIPKA